MFLLIEYLALVLLRCINESRMSLKVYLTLFAREWEVGSSSKVSFVLITCLCQCFNRPCLWQHLLKMTDFVFLMLLTITYLIKNDRFCLSYAFDHIITKYNFHKCIFRQSFIFIIYIKQWPFQYINKQQVVIDLSWRVWPIRCQVFDLNLNIYL